MSLKAAFPRVINKKIVRYSFDIFIWTGTLKKNQKKKSKNQWECVRTIFKLP